MSLLNAQDRRTIPLDMYLIIDGSSALEQSRTEIMTWINEQVDRILMDGDRITIWAAGDSARIIHSATISGDAGRREIMESLRALETRGQTADFSGALMDLASRLPQTPGRNRLSYSMLITASAAGLQPALTGGAQQLLRWSRSEKSARWQALVVAPNIGGRVQQAVAAYMSSQR